MRNIVLIGGGLVGSYIAKLLCREPDLVVTVCDLDDDRLAALATFVGPNNQARLKTIRANALAPGKMAEVTKDAQVVISAVPGSIGLRTVTAAIECDKPVVDISYMPEDPFEVESLAKKHGVPVVPDVGVAPGLSNFFAGRAAAQLGALDKLLILVCGLPTTRKFPFEYAAVFSPADVIEEYTRPARLVENGVLLTKPALTDVELHTFDGVGTLESFNTDGLRTLIRTMRAPNMKEKTMRYPGHANLMRAFREAGFFDTEPLTPTRGRGAVPVVVRPLDVTLALFERSWRLKPGETEFTLLYVEVIGAAKDTKDSKHPSTPTLHKHTYQLLDRTTDGVTSMARTTGTPAAFMAARIARGEFPATIPGVHVPETLAKDAALFDTLMTTLKTNGIHTTHTVTAAT